MNSVINSADDRGITEAGESNTTVNPGQENFASFPTYVEKPSISAMGEENKRKERSKEQNQEQRRQEVTRYNKTKERLKLTQNHADLREPEGNPPT